MNHMEYQPDMEQLNSDMMERVLSAVSGMNPEKYAEEDVRLALASSSRSPEDFAALLSPAAAPMLEELALAAQKETRAHFGNSVYLFTPLYLSNYCENQCVYCGFNKENKIQRARLNIEESQRELEIIAESGLEEILLLTGESPHMSDVEYIAKACELAKRYFRLVGLEVYPMDTGDYRTLHEAGADFVTVFQETYDTNLYEKLHLAGRKRVFPYRFHAQERALLGGMRGVGLASLLGLGDFRCDAFATGIHAWLLQKKYPQAEIAFSVPRLRPAAGTLVSECGVSESELLQVIAAYRLFLPFANITISSREGVRFRDNAVKIAATKISAGVDVGIGGHTGKAAGDDQFEISDGRSVAEIRNMLKRQGLQSVMSEYLYI